MMRLRPVLPGVLKSAPCTALGEPPGGLVSMSLAGGPGAGCPGGALRTACAAPLAHPLLTQTGPGLRKLRAGILVRHQSKTAKPWSAKG